MAREPGNKGRLITHWLPIPDASRSQRLAASQALRKGDAEIERVRTQIASLPYRGDSTMCLEVKVWYKRDLFSPNDDPKLEEQADRAFQAAWAARLSPI